MYRRSENSEKLPSRLPKSQVDISEQLVLSTFALENDFNGQSIIKICANCPGGLGVKATTMNHTIYAQ